MVKRSGGSTDTDSHMEGEHVSNSRSSEEYRSPVDRAKSNPRKRYLRENNVVLYKCPTDSCEHPGFESKRDCRKHMDQKHSWSYYFGHEPFDSLNVHESKNAQIQLRSSAFPFTTE